MSVTNFFAVDLGATSGRTILGSLDAERKLTLKELTRFSNPIIEVSNHCYWDIFGLYHEIVKGLRKVAAENISIDSIGIDTWGVDFALFGKDGGLLRNPYSYRDSQTVGAMEEYFKLVPKERVYEIAGIQFMPFNSLFQLSTLRKNEDSALSVAEKILFMPDALSYLLTGEMVTEYTILSTSSMLDAAKGTLSEELLAPIGIKPEQFGRMVKPGEIVGTLSEELQRLTGLGAIPVVAVAGHDTASAVAAVPAEDSNFAYLSSGTWSLMGIESPSPIISKESYTLNFTNEGGVEGSTRFLKNICGMWLLERCRKEWTDAPTDYTELIEAAMAAPAFQSLINPDDASFANPSNMTEAIKAYCENTHQYVPNGYAEITRCIFDSLALRYKQVFIDLQKLAPFPIERLHVIGGGSRNALLNKFTSNALGIPVVAGPGEATAIGNIMIQAKAAGIVSNIDEMRKLISESVELGYFEPQEIMAWNEAYLRYLTVC